MSLRHLLLFFLVLITGISATIVSDMIIRASQQTVSPISTTAINQLPLATSIPTPTILPITQLVSPTTEPKKNYKKNYVIAVFGDSMIDTMSTGLPYLDKVFKEKYPDVNFSLYNYGIGGQNVAMGLDRFHNSYDYQDRHYPSLDRLKPDILIIGSFAYNPFSPYNRDRHWLGLTKLVEEAKKVSPHIYLLAEIAPLRANFGKGPHGTNWQDDYAIEHSGHIIEQLENVLNLAQNLNIPLINAFTPTFNPATKEGNSVYVNPDDGIHPSVSGHIFIANQIGSKIILPDQ